MSKLMPVNFRGATLYGVRLGGVVVVALKPIVQAMGLNWEPQRQRIQRDPILSEGTSIIKVPFGRGGPQDTLCLKLSLLNGWLFTINSMRIKDPTVRARVQIYQRECYDVLWRHFSMRRALPDQTTARNENRDIRLVHEARMIFGTRVAAKVWHMRGMPEVSGMDDSQGDLFDLPDHAA